MHLEEINTRLDDLFAVLQYCSEKTKSFTLGQRVCINQERAALFDRKNHLFNGLALECVRRYKVPPELEEKVQFTLTKIKDTNFTAYNTSWFIDPNKVENEYQYQ